MGKDRRDKGFRIPDDALKMAKTSLKKFKKKNDDYYDGKKEMKKEKTYTQKNEKRRKKETSKGRKGRTTNQ